MEKLSQSPYQIDVAESVCERQIEFNCGKHLKAYIEEMTEFLYEHNLQNAPFNKIVEEATEDIFNNRSQAWNHIFFFEQFRSENNEKRLAPGKLKDAITMSLGSLDSCIDKFTKAAVSLFGSGWTWLVVNMDNNLEIISTHNSNNPIDIGLFPIMVCDVWEHSYYLEKQDLRVRYVKDFWEMVDWRLIEQRYCKFISGKDSSVLPY